MSEEKPPQKNPLGPSGARVMENLKQIREERRLSYRELSDRLAELGRPIPTLGLSRIEKGERRVDADDLVALALALDVTPSRLLLPATAGTDRGVDLTGAVTAPTEDAAWRWACGEYDLFPLDAPTPLSKVLRFLETNRPHVAKAMATLERDVAEQEAALVPIAHAVRLALRRGVRLQTIIEYLRATDALDVVGEGQEV